MSDQIRQKRRALDDAALSQHSPFKKVKHTNNVITKTKDVIMFECEQCADYWQEDHSCHYTEIEQNSDNIGTRLSEEYSMTVFKPFPATVVPDGCKNVDHIDCTGSCSLYCGMVDTSSFSPVFFHSGESLFDTSKSGHSDRSSETTCTDGLISLSSVSLQSIDDEEWARSDGTTLGESFWNEVQQRLIENPMSKNTERTRKNL